MNIDTQFGQSASTISSVSWEKSIRLFEQQDRKAPPPLNATVFAGSSTFTFWKEMQSDFAPIPVINRGFGGSEIRDVLQYADRIIIPYAPKQVVLYAGGNDLANGRMPREIFHDYHRLVDIIHASLPKTMVSFVSIKLSPAHAAYKDAIRVTNHLVAAYTKDHPLTDYIDTYALTLDEGGHSKDQYYKDDGVHLNRVGYELWIPVIKAALVE
jgi:lysophospholipase L1-like esterase